MLKVTQRYLAASFIPPMVVSSLFFISFLLTFQLFRITRIVIKKGVELTTVLELIGHIAISFIPMAVPLSALFATMYALHGLSEDSEIIAMRSFGMKKGQLLFPFLLLGLLVSLSVYALNQNIIPHSKTAFINTIIKLTSRGMLTDIKAENFFTEIPNITLFVENVDSSGKKMEGVFIQIKGHDESFERVIFAKSGVLIKQKMGEMQTPYIRLNLYDGNIIKTYKNKSEIEKILFKEYDFPILTGGFTPGFVEKDSMRTNSELRWVLDKNTKKIQELEEKGNLDKVQEGELKNLKKRLAKTQLEFWSRINTPIQCIVFIFLGFCLGIKQGRGKTKNTGVIGFIILIAYYAIFFAGVSLSKKGYLSASTAVFIPTLITALVATKLYSKMDWIS